MFKSLLFKDKVKPLNQRLDEMGEHYRPIYGNLGRVLDMIDYASTLDPPRLNEGSFKVCADCLATSMEHLRQAHGEATED